MRRRIITKGRLLAVAAVLLLAGLALTWAVGALLVRATPSAVPDAAAPATDLAIRSSDGLRIAASYWPGRHPAAPAVLLLHGNGASRAATAENARWLSELGYAAMTIDFRGHGESDRTTRSFGLHESHDAEAAFRWLKGKQRGAKVAVVGISLGGAASLIGSKGPLPADAVVLQAVYPDIRSAIRNRIGGILGRVPAAALEPLLSEQSRLRLGVPPSRLAPLRAIASYRGPVLVVGGARDHHTPPEEVARLYEAAAGPKSMWIAPNLDHPQVSDVRSPEYRARLLGFLQRTIGRP